VGRQQEVGDDRQQPNPQERPGCGRRPNARRDCGHRTAGEGWARHGVLFGTTLCLPLPEPIGAGRRAVLCSPGIPL